MNPTQEQMITKAQAQQETLMPTAVRRGRAIAEHIDAVVRGLFVRGHRVFGLRIHERDLADLSKWASTQPGQRLSGHGYLHDELGYLRIAGPGSDQHPDSPHIGFDVAGQTAEPGVIVQGRGDVDRQRFFGAFDSRNQAAYDEMDADAREDAADPPAYAGADVSPGMAGVFGEALEEFENGATPAGEGSPAESAPAEGGSAGTEADGSAGAGPVDTPAVLSGVSDADGTAAADVSGSGPAATGVSGEGGASETLEAKPAPRKRVKSEAKDAQGVAGADGNGAADAGAGTSG